MRGIPKTLGTIEDVYNLARGLPVIHAVAFMGELDDDAWERLGASVEAKEELRAIVAGRLAKEDKKARQQKARATALGEQIAARSDAEAIARDARRIKEELDDVRAHLADLRADGAEEENLKDLAARLVALESMFAAALMKHMSLIGALSRLRKQAKDEEEV